MEGSDELEEGEAQGAGYNTLLGLENFELVKDPSLRNQRGAGDRDGSFFAKGTERGRNGQREKVQASIASLRERRWRGGVNCLHPGL